jgi:hypothetical protein
MGFFVKSLILMAFISIPGYALGNGPTVESIGGASSIKISRAGQEVVVKKGDQLQLGDEIRTPAGVALDLRFPDRSVVRVGVNTQYRIAEEEKGILHTLMNGVVRVLVPKSSGSSLKFRMRTAEGTIGVRGTEFVVSKDQTSTRLRGLEGEVAFGEAGAKDFLSGAGVKAGFESTAKVGSKPSAPQAYPLAEYLKELSSAKGPFGPLSGRVQAVRVRERKGQEVAKAPAGSSPSLASRKIRDLSPPKFKPDTTDWDDRLFVAALNNDGKGVTEALKKGAAPNRSVPGENGATALHFAAKALHYESVAALIKGGANVNHRDQEGITPLMFVAEVNPDERMAALLHQAGADPNAKDKFGLDIMVLSFRKLDKIFGELEQNHPLDDFEARWQKLQTKGDRVIKFILYWSDGSKQLELWKEKQAQGKD